MLLEWGNYKNQFVSVGIADPKQSIPLCLKSCLSGVGCTFDRATRRRQSLDFVLGTFITSTPVYASADRAEVRLI